nr:hypothetical protein CFP56_65286 [Quercus suber]
MASEAFSSEYNSIVKSEEALRPMSVFLDCTFGRLPQNIPASTQQSDSTTVEKLSLPSPPHTPFHGSELSQPAPPCHGNTVLDAPTTELFLSFFQ